MQGDLFVKGKFLYQSQRCTLREDILELGSCCVSTHTLSVVKTNEGTNELLIRARESEGSPTRDFRLRVESKTAFMDWVNALRCAGSKDDTVQPPELPQEGELKCSAADPELEVDTMSRIRAESQLRV